jgi:diguanylate cyclase (GGDEF)-like protein
MLNPVPLGDCENIFEWAPISLWLEDYSALHQLFGQWRTQGVTDLRSHLVQTPDRLLQCARCIQVVRVNRQTLLLTGAQNQTELVARLPEIFRDEMLDAFIIELENLWNGRLSFSKETVNYTLHGYRMDAQIHVRVLPGSEEDWGRVLVTMEDVTARKKAAANLEYISTHDPLTGLHNRTFFATELERITEQKLWPLCIVAMDLNGLKHVNDVHGHADGDALLRRVGEVLRMARMDKQWSMVRMGGDEFLALLPSTEEAAAQKLIQRIDDLVGNANLDDSLPRLSLSKGLASCSSPDMLDVSLHLADQQMFAAKTQFYEMAKLERRRG